MRRAANPLVSIAFVLSTLGLGTQGVAAHEAHVWSNSDAFSVGCLGFVDTYPQKLYSLNVSQMSKLGYSVTGTLGAGFTRAAFLGNVFADYGVYVHSHGDNYWAATGAPKIDSAFMQDPGVGKCNDRAVDLVRSSQIKRVTLGTQYNLVIMSTCMLGASSSTMPDAFQIEKTKSSTQPEFYLGYVNSTYDSSALRFEQAFWSYMNGGTNRTFYQAFTYAAGIGGYAIPDSSNPFVANWWGNPNYTGKPGL